MIGLSRDVPYLASTARVAGALQLNTESKFGAKSGRSRRRYSESQALHDDLLDRSPVNRGYGLFL